MDFQEAIVSLARAQAEVTRLERIYQPQISELKTAENAFNQQSVSLRKQAEQWFTETGDRKPHDAITIKSIDHRVWATQENVEQALVHDPKALAIDPVAFHEAAAVIGFNLLMFQNNGLYEARLAAAFAIAEALKACLTIDKKYLEELRKQDNAQWAEPEIKTEQTVYMKSQLGEYLIPPTE